MFNVLGVSYMTVVDSNINAVLNGLVGTRADGNDIPVNGGVFINPSVGNFPVDYGTSTPSVGTVLRSIDGKADQLLAR